MKDVINNVFNNVFNNISNTQATKFTDEKTEKKAEWKRVNNGPPGKLKIDSNVIKCSNRYEDLRTDNDCEAVISADNVNDQDDVDQIVKKIYISNNKRPQVVINKNTQNVKTILIIAYHS